MGKSDYLENRILNSIFNGAAFPVIGTVYIALFTAAPTDAGGGTEVAGGSYARKAITCNTTNFPATTTGMIQNAVAQAFAQASAAWGTVVAFGVFDALTAGNLLYHGAVSPNKTVASGDTLSIAVNQLQISEE